MTRGTARSSHALAHFWERTCKTSTAQWPRLASLSAGWWSSGMHGHIDGAVVVDVVTVIGL